MPMFIVIFFQLFSILQGDAMIRESGNLERGEVIMRMRTRRGYVSEGGTE